MISLAGGCVAAFHFTGQVGYGEGKGSGAPDPFPSFLLLTTAFVPQAHAEARHNLEVLLRQRRDV
jgi:hypothetical protein